MRCVRILLPLVLAASGLAAPAAAQPEQPEVVLALIDTGINPYSPVFRDQSARAHEYPGNYLPGYPAEDDVQNSAIALNLTLDPPEGETEESWTFAKAFAADQAEWAKVFSGFLYWIPGTRIVGAVSLGRGGTNCGNVPDIPPAGGIANGYLCKENKILDDAGHGTMTASRSAGIGTSLGEGARIVMVEGPGTLSVNWVASQPWIDLVSNSWGSAFPGPSDVSTAVRAAVDRQLWLFASGNGAAFTQGFAPQPTQVATTGVPGAVLVGAHDNGKVSAWSGAPAHVVADGYGGWTGTYNSRAPARPDPVSCCTSAAAPYAAGGAAAILMEARRLLGDTGTGLRDGNLAIGTPPEGASPMLADGALSLAEWRTLLERTAEALPAEGTHDGLMHFLGGPGVPQRPEYGPGENPFCLGCWTLPLRWTEIPAGFPAHHSIGYGGVNERSIALARAVLRGEAALPLRLVEDEYFEQDRAVREAIFGGP